MKQTLIRIEQISLTIEENINLLKIKAAQIMGIKVGEIKNISVVKRAIDSRKKRQMIYFIYSVNIELNNTESFLQKLEHPPKHLQKGIKHHRIKIAPEFHYEIPKISPSPNTPRPIVVGSGPCGLFCALTLAKAGCKPLVIERGSRVEKRMEDIQTFQQTGKLDLNSNIQFGEGGAGTFSDGKLNTLTNDPRIKHVFDELIAHGAPEEISWDATPHIGTDKLRHVVKNMRQEIIRLGGEVRFDTRLTNIKTQDNRITTAILNETEEIQAKHLVLAIGHSARDTYQMLFDNKLTITPKDFSIGVRIEHSAEMINKSQYEKFYNHPALPTGRYKLVTHSQEGNRSAYTFCMCPGGYVVGATSEAKQVVSNGMSEYAQDGNNSNSALLVTIKKEDFDSPHPLAGVEFQRQWERLAFQSGGSNYFAPAQLVGDFLADKPSTQIKSIKPTYLPGVKMGNLSQCLPDYVIKSLREALPALDRKINGFAHPEAIMTGVETRTTAPLRIFRDETHQSNIAGIYPAGEGAGYAGGITSSAVDGLRVAEAIIEKSQK